VKSVANDSKTIPLCPDGVEAGDVVGNPVRRCVPPPGSTRVRNSASASSRSSLSSFGWALSREL